MGTIIRAIPKEIAVGKRTIGMKQPCFIIAEAGVNHNGDVVLAKKLVDAAADAKVDAVKFQTFKAERLVTKDAQQVAYQTKNIGKKESQFAMLKRLELQEDDFRLLKAYAEKKVLIFLSTPFDEQSIDFLDQLGVVAFKAGSSELNNTPYLLHMAKKGKPMIISTGMASMEEIKDAVESIRVAGNDRFIVLHCTTNYPCPYEDVNMNAMVTLRDGLGCLTGYSDHTQGIVVPLVAVSMGAVVIEKHFTLDRTLPGPDHKASLEPKELKEMVRQIRLVETIKGSSVKKPTSEENAIAKLARKSIVAAVDIPKGIVLTKNHLIIKRPGTGLPPSELEKVVGRTTKAAIKKDGLIMLGKLR